MYRQPLAASVHTGKRNSEEKINLNLTSFEIILNKKQKRHAFLNAAHALNTWNLWQKTQEYRSKFIHTTLEPL